MAVIAALADNLEAIRAHCREYGVERLEVFGSAARVVHFGSSSDIDILIEFAPEVRIPRFSAGDCGVIRPVIPVLSGR